MEPLSPHLRDIASYLKSLVEKTGSSDRSQEAALNKIADKIGKTTIDEVNVNTQGNTNTSNINETLLKGLVQTTTVEGQTVQTAIQKLINDSLLKGLVYTYEENGTTVQKGLAQIMGELKETMVNVQKALDGTTAAGVGAKVGTIATNTGNIRTDTNNLATYINTIKGYVQTIANNSGSSGSSIDLTTIEGYLDEIAEALDGTTAAGVSARLNAMSNRISDGSDKVATAITKKTSTPAASLIVEGTVNTTTMVFTPNSGQPSISTVIAAYQQGQLIFFKYTTGSAQKQDMVTFCNIGDTILKSQGGYVWTGGGSATLFVYGTKDYYNRFTPNSGQPTFDNVKDNWFSQGFAVWLVADSTYSYVTGVNNSLHMFVTADNWSWTRQ